MPFEPLHSDLRLALRESGAAPSPAASNSLRSVCSRFYVDSGTAKPNHYLDIYETAFASIRYTEFSMLELGVSSGQSLLAWREYFPKARIVGLDIRAMPKAIEGHVNNGSLAFIQGDQSSPTDLARCIEAGGPFDVIIDDASHVGALSRASFEYLFPHGLKPGGSYFIEDYGTGYMPDFYDGSLYGHEPYTPDDKVFPSHSSGMIGWVKQLIDITHIPALGVETAHAMPISSIAFWPSIALVKKA